MDWKTIKPELIRIFIYLVMALAARGGYTTIMPAPTIPPQAPLPPPTWPAPPPQPAPPPAPPPGLPVPKIDPEQAIVRIQSGSAGCTATIIGPSPVKGVQLALSAAHCVRGEGVAVRLWHKSGKVYDGKVYRRNTKDDLALIVIKTDDPLSYAKVAEMCPSEGTKIWHQGYGVDRPGNHEEGTVIRNGCDGGFTALQIKVSSGDSGCGFFRKDNGELIATCYGTDNRWTIGPGVTAIRAFLRSAAS